MPETGRRILVVDDEADIRRLIRRTLAAAGFLIEEAETGREALEMALRAPPDLIVIDLGLPDTDGLSLTRSLKERTRCGLVIVSGRGEPIERIIGLEIGADDYLAKPFEPRELVARVRSVLRRLEPASPAAAPVDGAGGGSGPLFRFQGWALHQGSRRLVRPDGLDEELTTGEFNLLLALVERSGRVLTRDQLLELTHGNNTPAFDRSVDVQIGRLRRKIERDPAQPAMIRTIRNSGYMFAVPAERS